MKRNVSLEEISDGKLYTLNDMVKADCHDCRGCSACCRGMGSSIILDPLDVCRLSVNLGKSFDELLEKELELGMVDGAILPNLRMTGPEEACVFWTAGAVQHSFVSSRHLPPLPSWQILSGERVPLFSSGA